MVVRHTGQHTAVHQLLQNAPQRLHVSVSPLTQSTSLMGSGEACLATHNHHCAPQDMQKSHRQGHHSAPYHTCLQHQQPRVDAAAPSALLCSGSCCHACATQPAPQRATLLQHSALHTRPTDIPTIAAAIPAPPTAVGVRERREQVSHVCPNHEVSDRHLPSRQRQAAKGQCCCHTTHSKDACCATNGILHQVLAALLRCHALCVQCEKHKKGRKRNTQLWADAPSRQRRLAPAGNSSQQGQAPMRQHAQRLCNAQGSALLCANVPASDPCAEGSSQSRPPQ